MEKKDRAVYFLALALALIALAVHATSLANGFVGWWDDNAYVVENPFIRYFSFDFIKWAFFEFHMNNWHPLTWLSHAVDYAVWGLSPAGHHLTNVLLHGAVTFVVVLLVRQLLQARRKRAGLAETDTGRRELIAAGVVGALFGLHPVHVESVAWVAERKDLLCGLFYLLSVRAYVRHAEGDGGIGRQYGWALGWFVVALLSKPMAVSLPVVLLILDWYPLERLRSVETAKRLLVEKLPFVALSLLSSFITLQAQKTAIAAFDVVPFPTRLLVAAKSLVLYLWKMVSLDLIPFYPYPKNEPLFTVGYAASIAALIGIVALCIALAKRGRKAGLAAFLYYSITLLPVLGIVQVGAQAMADRYMYLPSIAPFLLVGVGVARGLEKLDLSKKAVKGAGAALAAVAVLFLSYATVKQISIWGNGFLLWNYVIVKSPYKIALAHNNRGIALLEMGQFDNAIADFDAAITLNPSLAEAYSNRGMLYGLAGAYEASIESFSKAISVNPRHADAYVNRGLSYLYLRQYDKAMEDFNKAIQLKPYLASAYLNRGDLFLRQNNRERAAEDFQNACVLGNALGCRALQNVLNAGAGRTSQMPR